MAVSGDLRFISHRDCLRAVQQAATRAQLPLKYSQGFNPHPVLSLPVPRPVGVETCDDRLVLNLTRDLDPRAIVEALNEAAPAGMTFDAPTPLAPKATPQPRRIRYRLALAPKTLQDLRPRVEAFAQRSAWEIQRAPAGKAARKQNAKPKPLDLKPLVEAIHLTDNELGFTLVPSGDLWARPAELLAVLGLDACEYSAGLTRTAVDYDNETTGTDPDASSDPADAENKL